MAGRKSSEGLVAKAATHLRTKILAQPPGTWLGALPDLAAEVNVGIETIRQAARLLEHEGLLDVRRGNRGGFYGVRPDAAALGRSVATFMTESRSHEREAIGIMTLLDCDLVADAALSADEPLRARLSAHADRIDACDTAEQRAAFVREMHDILFAMVDRPLMEMMARLSMEHYTTRSGHQIYEGAEGTARWKQERHAIVQAILRRDPDLARFEAQRRRDYVLQRVTNAPPPAPARGPA